MSKTTSPGKSNSDNSTHDANVQGYEAVRQASVVPTASKTTVVTAEATYNRNAVKSAAANSCSPVPFMTALRENGQSLYP